MSINKKYQHLFENYQLSEEEENWCWEFEINSGLEPIWTEFVKDKKTFLEMVKENNKHVLDLAKDVVFLSEKIAYSLSYYDQYNNL